jgi:hypothetical protein
LLGWEEINGLRTGVFDDAGNGPPPPLLFPTLQRGGQLGDRGGDCDQEDWQCLRQPHRRQADAEGDKAASPLGP